MENNQNFEIIIVGGSYAGLSAAMSLGRALRRVLVIDSAEPCNRFTPHSHNFITQDGQVPADIASKARAQVAKYDTVTFYDGLATQGTKTATGFEITAQSKQEPKDQEPKRQQKEEVFTAQRLIFATGLNDLMPLIPGFAECWGKSVLHCPYCHGYEVKHTETGIIANGEQAYHYAQLISQWTKTLKVFTNGAATFTEEQIQKLAENNIELIETEIDRLDHQQGKVQQVVFKDGVTVQVNAIYSSPETEQKCAIPAQLGCEIEDGLIKVDGFQKTSIDGVFACGDNSFFGRAVSVAVSSGTIAGSVLNNEMAMAAFQS